MNENVAQVMATQKLLEKESVQLEREITDLDAKIKAAIKQGRDDIAKTYISSLQEKQTSLDRSREQLEQAKVASQKAVQFRDNYILQMKKRSAEAMQLINAAKQAKMQEQLARTMATFQVGDESSTFDEMRDKINRRSAAAEARMDLATTGVDAKIQDIEREAFNIQVDDTLLAYKRQMGLNAGDANMGSSLGGELQTGEKSLGPGERARATE
jgi:phage shock protein A